jgi:hypothetical protein
VGSRVKYSLLGLVVLLILIQLIPVDRNNPSIDETLEIKAPAEVMEILGNSCYDCHSNQTNWPFYSYIAPVSWLVASDVEEGRAEFNFSEWSLISPAKQAGLKNKMVEEIEEDKMPLPTYLIIHSNAKLSNQQKQIIKNWANVQSDE